MDQGYMHERGTDQVLKDMGAIDPEPPADWTYNRVYGVIRFGDGSEVFMQGEEAAAFDDQVEACETEEQIQMLLDQYSDVAFMPEEDAED
jgi:hypothetical protein